MQYLIAVLLLAAACSGGPKSELPDDYATTFTKVRPCLPSIEHATKNVVVFASLEAVTTFQSLADEYPDGAMLVKEEYAGSDQSCSGAIRQWTTMRKLPVGSSSGTLDWHWQEVDKDGDVTEDDDQRCISCHTDCVPGGSQGGYRFTCSAPGQE